MAAISIRQNEACSSGPFLYWDTIWVQRIDASGGYGDWILAGDGDQKDSRGGLRSEAALHTATILQLFTDAQAEEGDRLPDNSGDRRGWWGNSIRLPGEPDYELGSTIWVEIERGVLTEDVAKSVKRRAEWALAVLVDQGAVARTDVATGIDTSRGLLWIDVSHFSHDGETVYEQRFGVVWQQIGNSPQMTFGDVSYF
jgi:phage gp46-like protein